MHVTITFMINWGPKDELLKVMLNQMEENKSATYCYKLHPVSYLQDQRENQNWGL